MKKQHVNRWTSLWLALIMVLVSILGPIPAVMAQDFDPAEPALVVDAAATVPDAEMAEEEVAQVELPAEEEALPVDEVVEAAAEEIVGAGGLTDFSSPQGGLTIDEEAGTVTLSDIDDNHYAVYNGLDEEVNSFTLEADVMFKEDQDTNCAALIFGLSSKSSPGARWNGANLDSGRKGDDAFRIFGPDLNETNCGSCADIDFTIPVHFKLEINEIGEYTYSFGNNGVEPGVKSGKLNSWAGGYVGILTWNSEATFSNITFEGEYVDTTGEATVLDVDPRFNTNLTGLKSTSGTWEVTDDGLYSDARDNGDCFLFSETSCDNFVFSTDVKSINGGGAAALIFRNGSSSNNKNCYAVNIDIGAKRGKFWRWVGGRDMVIGNDRECPASSDDTYTLKVVAYDGWVSFYVNDVLIASTGDYTIQPDDRGQNTCLTDGYFGLLNWNGEMVFQNTLFTPIDGDFNPLLEDITVESSGTVEKKGQFFQEQPVYIQYVENDASTVDIVATPVSSAAEVTVIGPDGNEYAEGKGIPVEVGVNYITVLSTVKNDDDAEATLTYRVNVHRRQPNAVYYNEPYRSEYHYSLKDGWANDPNGLVYYKGKYHFFYQFYDAKQWGPMHWAHATSTDLIHWEEQPIALYPDENGAMFSGCMVIDDTNASGLFSTDEGGLVALITCDGNGQRIKLAYSEDEGETWTKVDKIAADWTDDPLGTDAFRDPKVFHWENKWFMVLAGGPLRIYSSDNLLEWKCETPYGNLHTECPDLYPIKASDGNIKWVLSRGGRLYKVGDFEEVDGKWKFIPDSDYENSDGIMNFGKDFYAAMTFYVQDFGTAANPTLPDILEINWANTWDDYCNAVANKVGQDFNGIFNMILKAGLVKDGDKYVLTQTPIEAYKDLRGDAVIELKGAEVTADNTLLDDFAGDCYEIESTFYPGAGTTKVGFKLRVGEDESTDIMYDIANETMSIDRSKSGIQISGKFSEVDRQKVTPNDDGSITMHIFMDKSIVEVFTKDDTAVGSNQIFPSSDSLGAKIVAEGGDATADVTIYPMNTIWEKETSDVPLVITSVNEEDNFMYAGDKLKMKVTLLPVNVAQDVEWTIEDSSVATIEANGGSAVVSALKKGETTITATSVEVPELSKTFNLKVLENNFETNLEDWTAVNGTWIVDDKTLHCDNRSSNDFYMAGKQIAFEEYTLETKLNYKRGLINVFFAANAMNPFDRQAYAIQVGDSPNVRLFRFGGDTIAEGNMGKTINDGQYHDVKITKTKDNVKIEIDGAEALDFKMENPESFYNTNPYVGIGLWDGDVDVQTFYVNEIKEEVTPTPTPTPTYRFSDVQNPKHAYFNAIYWAADAGITKGYEDGTFGIDKSCTRGEMMMFLWRYANKPAPKAAAKSPFKDVKTNHVFYKAILWGSQKGITKGYSDGTFGINRKVTRGEAMMFLWRLKGKPAPKAAAKSPFKDVPTNHVFYKAILWGSQKKITTGYTSGPNKGKFMVNDNCTRGQIVTFLYRAK